MYSATSMGTGLKLRYMALIRVTKMQNNEMSGSSADMSTERTRESNIILQRVAVRANSATFLPFINTQ